MKKKEKAFSYLALEYKQMVMYLESMALNGWELIEIPSILFHQIVTANFIKIRPQSIQFCVDFVSNNSLDYFKSCKESDWTYVASTRYFHVFKHYGDFITPLQSDDALGQILVEDKIYAKELKRFYRWFYVDLLLLIPAISCLMFPDSYGDSKVSGEQDIYMLYALLIFNIYIVTMIMWMKHGIKKRFFLHCKRKPISRFLGVYPFSFLGGIFVWFDVYSKLKEGKLPIDGSTITMVIIVTICITLWHAFTNKSYEYFDEQTREKSIQDSSQ